MPDKDLLLDRRSFTLLSAASGIATVILYLLFQNADLRAADNSKQLRVREALEKFRS